MALLLGAEREEEVAAMGVFVVAAAAIWDCVMGCCCCCVVADGRGADVRAMGGGAPTCIDTDV